MPTNVCTLHSRRSMLMSCAPSAGDSAYDAFAVRHGRRHGSAEEYEGRRQVFYENRVRINAWNAAGNSHECVHPWRPFLFAHC